MTKISNKTFEEIRVGDHTTSCHLVTEELVKLFALASTDTNPLHLDEDFASKTPFKGRIAHGMLSGAFISAAIANQLPGPGSIYVSQSLRFLRPVHIGDELSINIVVINKQTKGHRITLECHIKNQNGKKVVSGEATVIAPTEKHHINASPLPRMRWC